MSFLVFVASSRHSSNASSSPSTTAPFRLTRSLTPHHHGLNQLSFYKSFPTHKSAQRGLTKPPLPRDCLKVTASPHMIGFVQPFRKEAFLRMSSGFLQSLLPPVVALTPPRSSSKAFFASCCSLATLFPFGTHLPRFPPSCPNSFSSNFLLSPSSNDNLPTTSQRKAWPRS